jgi:hypothetical protein
MIAFLVLLLTLLGLVIAAPATGTLADISASERGTILCPNANGGRGTLILPQLGEYFR